MASSAGRYLQWIRRWLVWLCEDHILVQCKDLCASLGRMWSAVICSPNTTGQASVAEYSTYSGSSGAAQTQEDPEVRPKASPSDL